MSRRIRTRGNRSSSRIQLNDSAKSIDDQTFKTKTSCFSGDWNFCFDVTLVGLFAGSPDVGNRRTLATTNGPRSSNRSPRLRHPWDPLNVRSIGSKIELLATMKSANWYQADALGIESDLEIDANTMPKRTYDEATVSRLILLCREEVLAMEEPAKTTRAAGTMSDFG
ncbi:LssY C-terminal domain-containing protein [Rubripirellula reticaptiva]|uniref:LssY-like C-terminal domain-containing protein n=1 Tax=Rubripirellula reticaptiva TaxID=2528013 RepID=A0A5C6F6U6_9BACT|nr:LssY C-terminal domain-containing protein [Rubripirellula reticaptiva]TWU57098.1 hypothetical protein Poly59_00030 [Rubripirellula reticaptiva]